MTKMQVIVKATESIEKLWGNPKPKDREYRLMKYTLKQECTEGTLIHNCITGEMVLLDNSEAELIGKLPAKADEWMTQLIAHHFLVPITTDECKVVRQLRDIRELKKQAKHVTGYTILPTTYCNARCFYCYEANYKHIHMSEETAAATVDYIAKKSGGEKISIGWFGGEPTLGSRAIDRICEGLQAKDIEYSSSMISNGYLFDESMVKKAVELWKLSNIQITLDGTEGIYNQVKAYVGIQGSAFQRVLRNIDLLIKADIRVVVRMNLDRHNHEDLKQLTAILEERFKDAKRFHAYTHVLFDDEGFDPVRHTQTDKAELEEKSVELNTQLDAWCEPSRKRSLPKLKFSACMADNDGSVIIAPDGSIAKCEHFCEEALGTIFGDEPDRSTIESWKEHEVMEICCNCPLYPNCIRLKRCPSARECDEHQRNYDIENSCMAMIDIYEQYNTKPNNGEGGVNDESV